MNVQRDGRDKHSALVDSQFSFFSVFASTNPSSSSLLILKMAEGYLSLTWES